MEKNQEDTLGMYQSTNDVLLDDPAIYAANLPFTAAVEDLGDGIEDIEGLRDQQDEDIKGVTEDKGLKRSTLEERTYTVGSIIVFYASAIKNRKLLQKVNFTRSELTKARDNELPGMAEQVHQEAVANDAALLPYGLTDAMTTALDTAKTEFVADISKPRAALSGTSAATEQLPGAFAVVNELLEERLDKGMELYRVSHPDFYAAYFNARIIINSPTLKRALEVKFVDSVTSAIIQHVRAKIDGSINRRSSKLGNIRVQNLTEGAHTLTANIPGYNPASQPFNVISGETTKITVSMVKS